MFSRNRSRGDPLAALDRAVKIVGAALLTGVVGFWLLHRRGYGERERKSDCDRCGG